MVFGDLMTASWIEQGWYSSFFLRNILLKR